MVDAATSLNVIIVNYCTPDLVVGCVNSIVSNGVAAIEDIVVVDSCSPDNSFAKLRERLTHANVVQTEENAGYGAGVNFGAKHCSSEVVLLLNPDTYFEDNSIYGAIEALKADPKVAIAGLDLIYPNGDRQYSSRRFYSCLEIIGRRTPLGRHWPLKSRIDSHLMKSSWDAGDPFEADWVMGTGILVRREMFLAIGGMDEAYFLYMEDTDLCARVWAAGFKVLCVPGARLVHDHQRSSVRPFSSAGRAHLRSLMRFHGKFSVPIFNPPRRLALRQNDRTHGAA
jgi:N-acetylglucosaminyl-diphospho-decaprenol L-rhamnosyltransferase